VPGVIDAVKNGTDLSPYFRQVTDLKFAVTGGQLKNINNTYYLIGGHQFDGDYNPMNMPTFTQEYTNSIRKFRLDDDGETLTITHLPEMRDTAAFHRRDYNVVPHIFNNYQEGLIAFSGVFQINADLPHLNCVLIDSSGYQMDDQFAQYFNHYHCAHLPLYAASSREMHTLFFGGISQYYELNGHLLQDSDVPFVTTISRVTRDPTGRMTEYKLPISMPSFLGAASEFIRSPRVPRSRNGVILLDELSGDSTMVGYIVGGIASSRDNIFWTHEGDESVANHTVYKVYIIKNPTPQSHALNPQSNNGLQMQIASDPDDRSFSIDFRLNQPLSVQLIISKINGKIILEEDLSGQLHVGMNRIVRKIKPFKIGRIYTVTLVTKDLSATQTMIVKS
jgi:hypothetical protein